MKPIDYDTVMKLGFKRIESKDRVWEKQYGFPYFIVEKRVHKRFILEWDVHTRTVTLLRIGKNHDVKETMDIEDEQELLNTLKFFKEHQNDKHPIKKP